MRLDAKLTDVLKLFNEKALILEQSTFMRQILETPPGVRIEWKRGQPAKIESHAPDSEATRAFVLTFRFFIQKNEPTSFFRLAELYLTPDIPEAQRERFADIRGAVNAFLDAKSFLHFQGQPMTNRQIMNTVIYGDLAHADEEQHADYHEWSTYPLMPDVVKTEFATVLAIITRAVRDVRMLNEEVLILTQDVA